MVFGDPCLHFHKLFTLVGELSTRHEKRTAGSKTRKVPIVKDRHNC